MRKPKKVKTAPKHQGRVHHYGHKKVHHSVAWTVVIAWAIIGILAAYFLLTSTGRNQVDSKLGLSKASLKLNTIQYDTVGAEPYPVPPGYKFVIMSVTLTNASPYIFEFAPVVQTKVIDEKGQTWAMSPTNLAKPMLAGPFPSNTSRTGELSFLVPSNATKLLFVFDPQSSNGTSSEYILAK